MNRNMYFCKNYDKQLNDRTMKKLLVTALLTATVAGGTAQVKNQSHGYPIDPVPFTSVKVTDSFWGQRLNASREVTIPLAFSKCEETGRYTNFVNAAHPSDTIKVGGLAFDDTDVYKTIEGASYLLQTYPDKKQLNNRMHALRAFYCHEQKRASHSARCIRDLK